MSDPVEDRLIAFCAVATGIAVAILVLAVGVLVYYFVACL